MRRSNDLRAVINRRRRRGWLAEGGTIAIAPERHAASTAFQISHLAPDIFERTAAIEPGLRGLFRGIARARISDDRATRGNHLPDDGNGARIFHPRVAGFRNLSHGREPLQPPRKAGPRVTNIVNDFRRILTEDSGDAGSVSLGVVRISLAVAAEQLLRLAARVIRWAADRN